MRDDMFEELLESVRQGGAILRGEMEPARSFRFDDHDVKQLRERILRSQRRTGLPRGEAS